MLVVIMVKVRAFCVTQREGKEDRMEMEEEERCI